MLKLVKRYSNGKDKLAIVSKVEINNKNINYFVIPFYPEFQDGAEEKLVEELVKKGWLNCGKILINKKNITMIGQYNLRARRLIDSILFINAYWKMLKFWTRGDPEQDIPLSVKHFLFLVEKMSLVLGDNIVPIGKEMPKIIFHLEEKLKFRQSSRKGLW